MIKIADFGLSVNTESKDYFRMNRDSERRAFPIRRMAPESIMEGKFDEKTDVVSKCFVIVVHVDYTYTLSGHLELRAGKYSRWVAIPTIQWIFTSLLTILRKEVAI